CQYCFIFIFQAEDGIRYRTVTGVQTCALPICVGPRGSATAGGAQQGGAEGCGLLSGADGDAQPSVRSGLADEDLLFEQGPPDLRAEERRVGRKAGYSRWT